MTVQKRKKSKSTRNERQIQQKVVVPKIINCSTSFGKNFLRFHH
ncbi:MAG: 50S ribosomal protein L32 [Deltaproteobacteria bacterium]|nr:MAG: 50S ribosomal protein L32 [Deltaproteobacteria bacterium]